MKKRTILGLCLSIFSLFLFSCGIAESNDGSVSMNVDTATIVQRSIKSASFEVSEDEIFEKYAEYLNYELTAIVNYEIGGKSENKTFSLLKMNGKEAMELVNKLESMSDEDQESYFTDKFKSSTLTIENLPVGKTATFRMKIRQKIGFSVDLSEYEGLSSSEISKDEYLAISKEPVSTKISENTDITIKLTEYDESLDWEYKEEEQPSEKTVFSLTFTGTIPSEFADSVTQSGFESDYDNNIIYIFRKVNGKWGLNDTISIKAGTDFTLSGSTIKGSAVTQRKFSVGDTVAITMRLMHQTKTGDDGVYEPEKIFIGWSNEITLSKDGNDFDMGELTYKDEIYLMPAPETIVKAQINSTKEITAPYATVVISNAENEEPIVKEEFKFEPFSAEYDGEVHYVGIYTFDSTDEFNNLEDGTKLLATIHLYEDEARTKSVYEGSQGTQFYKKCQTDFSYQLYDDSSESGSSGTGEQCLVLNLSDENGGTLSSILGTNFYYAVVITDSAVDDISTASPLYRTVGSSDGSTSLMFKGDAISSILSSQAVYITFGIFETEDEAQTAAKTCEVSNGIYYCKNYPVSIETGTTEQYIDVHLTENSSGSGSTLTLNLVDDSGNPVTGDYCYALLITDSAVDDISTASPLFSTVGSSDGSTFLMFRGDAISSILSSQTFYITFGIFETGDEAQTAAKTGEVSNGIYYCKNYPVSIETGNTDQYIYVYLTENSSGSGSTLTLNLVDNAGGAISQEITYYYAIKITQIGNDTDTHDITYFLGTDDYLYQGTGSVENGAITIIGDDAKTLINYDGAFYVSVALFESIIDDSFFNDGIITGAVYTATASPQTIENGSANETIKVGLTQID